MDEISLDKYGRQISLGDWVAFPDKFLSSMDIKLGIVIGFTKKQVRIKAMTSRYSVSKNELVYDVPDADKWTDNRKPSQCIVVKYNPDGLIGQKTHGYI